MISVIRPASAFAVPNASISISTRRIPGSTLQRDEGSSPPARSPIPMQRRASWWRFSLLLLGAALLWISQGFRERN
jgi:hypothetical protein